MLDSDTNRAPQRSTDAVKAKFARINAAKQDFTDIYNQPDPRAYFAKLGAHDYRIPDEALPVFLQLIGTLGGERGPRVLDLGCSYGMNAAAIRYGLSMHELAAHYGAPEAAPLGAAQMAARDRALLAKRQAVRDVAMIGLDIAPRAIAYARLAGIIDDGIVADLETQPLTPAAARTLAGTDLIVSTGCIGYVGARTLRQIVDAVDGDGPWIASFVLRMFPFQPISEALAQCGLVTEKLEGQTFRQRRFADAAEHEKIIGQLAAKGIDTQGVESDGYLHAEFFLSRPADSVRAMPMAKLFGRNAGGKRRSS